MTFLLVVAAIGEFHRWLILKAFVAEKMTCIFEEIIRGVFEEMTLRSPWSKLMGRG